MTPTFRYLTKSEVYEIGHGINEEVNEDVSQQAKLQCLTAPPENSGFIWHIHYRCVGHTLET